MNPAEGTLLKQSQPTTASRRAPVAVLLLIVIGLYAYPISLLMRPMLDADIWWHLRTGEWIVEHHDVPRTDPFSAYGTGKDYVAYSWLYELAFYKLYQWFGLTGLLLFRILLCGAVLVAIHRFIVKREPRFLWSTALTALAFVALTNVLNERSWMCSMLFSLFTLEAVLRLRDGTAGRSVWLLPVAYALWVNLHVQFVYGLVLLGLACVAPVGDLLLGRPTSGKWADTFGTPAWKRLVALTAACAAATLLNPYFVHFYSVVLTYSSQTVPFQVENEFKSLGFRHYADWTFLALVLLGAVALGRRLARVSVFDVLLFAGATYISFKSRRDLWLLLFVCLALCTGGETPSLRQARQLVFTWPRVAAVAAGVAGVALFLGWQRHLSERSLAAAVDATYPAAAVQHIKDNHYAGPLFNEYNWGGYLIWALREYPVSMDGRVHVHGDPRLATHTNTVQGYDWEKDDELMKAGVVLLSNKDMGNPTLKPRKPLPSALRLHPHFRVAYEDDLAIVFVPREETAPKEP
jgi:hypothetical protein